MIKKTLVIAVTLIFSINNYPQNFNRPVPGDLFKYEFIEHSPVQGYFLTVPLKLGLSIFSPNFKSPRPTIIDSNGYIAWYHKGWQGTAGDFKYWPDDSVFTFTLNGISDSHYMIMDLNFEIIDSLTNVNNTYGDGHEFQILNNGNYILGASHDSVIDLSGYIFDGIPASSSTVVKSYVIQEFDPAHNLVFQWNSIDHIPVTETYDSLYGYNPLGFDYVHGNAIDEDDDGHLLVSMRHLNAVYKIDRNTGNTIWRLGGKSNDFTFTNDIGFSGQHDIRKLPNGNYSLFDNANGAPPPRKSRGVEYLLDTTSWTASRTWQYIHSPSFFARAMGNHQTTTIEDHLINYGLVFRPRPSIVFVDDALNKLTEFYFEDSVVVYRTHVANIPFIITRPEITCNNVGSGIWLSAPTGHNSYVWNTGDTSESIFITTPDTFQVWVDVGTGMMGSYPIMINNVTTDCMSNLDGIDEAETPVYELKNIDFWGREIIHPIPGQMYITILSNGKKRIKYEPY